MQMREKVGKSRNTVFFQWFVAPEGRKVGSLKRRLRSHLARGEMKNCTRCGAKHISKSKCTKHTILGPLLEVETSNKCTPLWREANFEVKMYKAHQLRTTFRSCDVEKSARHCAAKHISKSKSAKKLTGTGSTFGRSDVLSRGRRKGLCTFSKVSKTWGFCSISKNDGRRGTFEDDLQRCISRGRHSTKDMFIRDVRRSGRWFSWNGFAFWRIRSVGLLRWFCVTGAALCMTWHHFFVAGAVL